MQVRRGVSRGKLHLQSGSSAIHYSSLNQSRTPIRTTFFAYKPTYHMLCTFFCCNTMHKKRWNQNISWPPSISPGDHCEEIQMRTVHTFQEHCWWFWNPSQISPWSGRWMFTSVTTKIESQGTNESFCMRYGLPWELVRRMSQKFSALNADRTANLLYLGCPTDIIFTCYILHTFERASNK